MDFDPSAFLSVAMTEDQDAVYTAPDIPSPAKVPPSLQNIVVEGGLQLEQDMQIPVPMFGLLQQEHFEEEETIQDNEPTEDPIHVDIPETTESNSTPQPSPVEGTSSPCNRKLIHTSPEESRFRKELFNGHYEKVKIFRLHCSICDKHLGCAPWFTERQMRMHKLLNVVVCRKCFEFYGDINFPIEEGSEMYCCWCGQGGDCFCCSSCPKIVCKKCIKQNFGAAKLGEIEKNDEWSCFVCKPGDIWPHRALMWGLQRWSKGMRQLVAMLSKEEKQAKLSLDASHCCGQLDESILSVGLPPKSVLTKIPQVMIAPRYQPEVKEVLARPETNAQSNGLFYPNNHTSHPMNTTPSHTPKNLTQSHAPKNVTPLTTDLVTRVPGNLSQQYKQRHLHQQQPILRSVSGYHVRQQLVQRKLNTVNRPAPYPMNVPPTFQPPPQTPVYPPNLADYQALVPYRIPASSQYTEVENLKNNYLPTTNQPLLDISSLENGVKDIKNILVPTLRMVKEFEGIKNELANDLSKLTSYSESLSFKIKLAICNLAKANTDLIEAQRKLIDNKVSSVVSTIQFGVLNSYPIVNGTSAPVNQNPNKSSPSGSYLINVDPSPEIVAVSTNNRVKTPEPSSSTVGKRMPVTPSSSTGEEVEDAAIAMFCETVLEVGENKENKNIANKDQVTPTTEPKGVIKRPRGRPKLSFGANSKRKLAEIALIDLTDNESGKFDASHWCTKFKIVPCTVVLERLKIPRARE